MTGKPRQRPWRHICLLERGSIEFSSFVGASQSHAPSEDATNSVLRQPNFSRQQRTNVAQPVRRDPPNPTLQNQIVNARGIAGVEIDDRVAAEDETGEN